MAEGGVMRHGGTLRLALAVAAFLGSLSLVIWRQSRALEVLRDLDAARASRAGVESDRSRLNGEIQHMESRARVMAVAGAWWGMRVPTSDEEFVIMLRPDGTGGAANRGMRIARADLSGVAALLSDAGHD
jgi:cell division protein FtsL